MTPPHRQEVRREDGELLGYVRHANGAAVPTTVFGGALGVPTDPASARDTVRAVGLASLAEPWWTRLHGQWQQVWLVEVRADRVRVSSVDPGWGVVTGEWVEPDALHRRPPA